MPLSHLKKITYRPGNNYTPRRAPTLSPSRRQRQKRRWLGRLVTAGVLTLAGGVLFGFAAFAWYARNLPDPSHLSQRTANESTKIYDRTGQTLLYEIAGDQKSTAVKLADLPIYVKQATLVAEDRDFYSHRGFDLRGIARAVFVDILRGGKVQGGSTITQQLVKNTIVGGEKSISRKMKELILSYRIEQQFSKDEILEMYFNTIPYGSTAYGIEAASNLYFKKSSKDLTIAEATILAALPKAPSYLSPYGSHRDELIGRQQYIISEMNELGFLTIDEAERAKKEELTFTPIHDQIIAPHFVFYIREILSERYGERLIETGGLKITTTLDLYKQKIAEEEVAAGAAKNEERYQAKNAALVALDPKTGQILAMVGSRDYFDEKYDGNVNVTLRPRQPGSSFKPIVYAAAFLKGYTPDTGLYDVVTTFKTDTKDYTPHNYDGKEHGFVTMRQALAGSLNIPAVKTIYLTGIDNVLNLAQTLGYSTLNDRSRFGLSLVLGGGEVTLLEHSAAYQAFAREGAYHETAAILRVEDSHGQVLESYEESARQALPSNTARQVTSILTDNNARSYIFGSMSPLQMGDRPVGAKTGTTNDWHDGWTIGFTPSLVAGVWVGNNNNAAMARGADGVLVAAPIWNRFMTRVLGDTPKESFRAPDPVNTDKPILRGELAQTETVIIDRASGKLATNLTPPTFREERTYRVLHSILQYINKDDPLGPQPEDPTLDPNYQNWEEGIKNWAKKTDIETGEIPPRESDDVHTEANKPALAVVTPNERETIRGQTMNTTAVASAPRGLKGIRYFLDGTLVGTVENSGVFTINLAGVSTGFHTLRVEAFDDVENTTSIERLFNYIP